MKLNTPKWVSDISIDRSTESERKSSLTTFKYLGMLSLCFVDVFDLVSQRWLERFHSKWIIWTVCPHPGISLFYNWRFTHDAYDDMTFSEMCEACMKWSKTTLYHGLQWWLNSHLTVKNSTVFPESTRQRWRISIKRQCVELFGKDEIHGRFTDFLCFAISCRHLSLIL